MAKCIGDSCKEEGTSKAGRCLVHEKTFWGREWRRLMREAEQRGFQPPLCDVDGCEKFARLEGYEWAGECGDHEPLPTVVTSTLMVLGIHADSALAGLEADAAETDVTDAQRVAMAATGVRLLAAAVMEAVERIRQEEATRAASPAGRVLGKQRG